MRRSLFIQFQDQYLCWWSMLWGELIISDSLQFGFKSNVSTTQCSWLVSECVSHRAGTPVIITMLNCSKAFDNCEFLSLFQKLLMRKGPLFVYTEQEVFVTWGSAKSETFGIQNGTQQGSVLSPTLFAVYFYDLLVKLRQHGLGCHIEGTSLASCPKILLSLLW